MKKSKLICSVVIKTIAAAASVYAMIFNGNFLMSLTYFTNLSNIFADVMLMISLVGDVLIYKGKSSSKSSGFYFAKYLSMLCVVLTFLVYLCILAPTSSKGFFASYFNEGACSFCLHFILPVLAVADFFLFDYDFVTKKRYCLYAAIPPLLYVAAIVAIGQLFGIRWKNMSAPYNFLNYSAPAGWFGFDLSTKSSETLGIGAAYMIMVLCVIFIGLGALAMKLISLRKKAVEKAENGRK